MNNDCKRALSRISRICRDNIKAFNGYKPLWGNRGPVMTGAVAEARGTVIAANEILTEIKAIRREHRAINRRLRSKVL
jgi:hypothetical protein